MNPSEYFFKKRIENQRWYDSDEANESTITELDKRFIDREELKEKINKQIKEVKKVRDYPYSYKFLDTNQKKNLELECKYKIEAKKEILELLKEEIK